MKILLEYIVDNVCDIDQSGLNVVDYTFNLALGELWVPKKKDIKGEARSRKSKKTENTKSASLFRGYWRTWNLINKQAIIPAAKAFKNAIYRFEKQFDSEIR